MTAVLTVPQQEGVRWQEDFDRAERLIQRLRVALNVSYGATPWIVGHYSVQKAQAGRPKAISAILLTGRRYRHTYDRYQSPRILSDAQVESVGRIVTTPVKKKKLLYYVQRALDSLDFARTLPDDAARLLLTWTALETLLSPEDQRELSTNIALSLLGIDKVEDPPRTFRLVKRSYGVRSKVVHAFEVPAELDAAIDTANVQVERAIRYVIDTALSEGLSRDQLTVKLRNRVLCGIQARASRSPS